MTTRNEGDELIQLSSLKAAAPENMLDRLRKRLRLMRLGKDIIVRQAYGFWIVLDAFLKIFLSKPHPRKQKPPKSEEND